MSPFSMPRTSSRPPRDLVGDEESRFSFQERRSFGSGTLNLALRLEHESEEAEASDTSEYFSRGEDELEATSPDHLDEHQMQVQAGSSRMQWLATGEEEPFWKSNPGRPSQVGTWTISKSSSGTLQVGCFRFSHRVAILPPAASSVSETYTPARLETRILDQLWWDWWTVD
jgi:hypothetical protein